MSGTEIIGATSTPLVSEWQFVGGVFAVLVAVFVGFWQVIVKKPQPDPDEPVDTLSEAPPLPVATSTPPAQPLPPPPPPKAPEALDFSTQKAAFHSTRVLCDEMGLPLEKTVVVDGVAYFPKDIICATIFGESEFYNDPEHATNQNANSTDYGICQFNDGPPGVPPNKKWYIGPGKLFSSPEDVYANPERQVRYMINYWKTHGHLNPWYAYRDGPYKAHLLPGSRMWKLKV